MHFPLRERPHLARHVCRLCGAGELIDKRRRVVPTTGFFAWPLAAARFQSCWATAWRREVSSDVIPVAAVTASLRVVTLGDRHDRERSGDFQTLGDRHDRERSGDFQTLGDRHDRERSGDFQTHR